MLEYITAFTMCIPHTTLLKPIYKNTDFIYYDNTIGTTVIIYIYIYIVYVMYTYNIRKTLAVCDSIYRLGM
jgi:hypothetical protein